LKHLKAIMMRFVTPLPHTIQMVLWKVLIIKSRRSNEPVLAIAASGGLELEYYTFSKSKQKEP
ncbi:hypothetical protein ADT67_04685, partial [Levilactobacillus brevis]